MEISSTAMRHPLSRFPSRLLGFLACGACLSPALPLRADSPAWIEKSNKDAQVLLDARAEFQPESASFTGQPGYDDKVADLLPGVDARLRSALAGARDELKRRAALENDPPVKQDLAILIKAANDQIETEDLTYRLTLSDVEVGQLILPTGNRLLQETDCSCAPSPCADPP